jgi:hypothetical protein
MIDICSALPQDLRDSHDRIQALWRTIVAYREAIELPASPGLGACFHDWIVKYFVFVRVSAKDWPDKPGTICEKITHLSKQARTNFALPAVAIGELWWNHLQTMSSGNAFQEVTRHNHKIDGEI